MENETQQKVKREIDLIDVLKNIGIGIWKGILGAVYGLGWFSRFVYQEKIIVLAVIVLGCAGGFFLNREKVYRGEVEVQMKGYDAHFLKTLIDPMHDQCIHQGVSDIMRELGISQKEAKDIVDIKSHFYIDMLNDDTPDKIDYDDDFVHDDTLNSVMTDRLRLVVLCKDTCMFKEMTQRFRYFFTNNQQVQKENQLRNQQLVEMIKTVDNEICMLDSLRKREYFLRKPHLELTYDKTVLLNEREMKLFHDDILLLEKRKQELIWQKEIFEDGISFASEFEFNPRPVNHKIKVGIIFFFLSFFAGSCLALIWHYRKNIFGYLNKEV